jgi:hypothetical protein
MLFINLKSAVNTTTMQLPTIQTITNKNDLNKPSSDFIYFKGIKYKTEFYIVFSLFILTFFLSFLFGIYLSLKVSEQLACKEKIKEQKTDDLHLPTSVTLPFLNQVAEQKLIEQKSDSVEIKTVINELKNNKIITITTMLFTFFSIGLMIASIVLATMQDEIPNTSTSTASSRIVNSKSSNSSFRIVNQKSPSQITAKQNPLQLSRLTNKSNSQEVNSFNNQQNISKPSNIFLRTVATQPQTSVNQPASNYDLVVNQIINNQKLVSIFQNCKLSVNDLQPLINSNFISEDYEIVNKIVQDSNNIQLIQGFIENLIPLMKEKNINFHDLIKIINQDYVFRNIKMLFNLNQNKLLSILFKTGIVQKLIENNLSFYQAFKNVDMTLLQSFLSNNNNINSILSNIKGINSILTSINTNNNYNKYNFSNEINDWLTSQTVTTSQLDFILQKTNSNDFLNNLIKSQITWNEFFNFCSKNVNSILKIVSLLPSMTFLSKQVIFVLFQLTPFEIEQKVKNISSNSNVSLCFENLQKNGINSKNLINNISSLNDMITINNFIEKNNISSNVINLLIDNNLIDSFLKNSFSIISFNQWINSTNLTYISQVFKICQSTISDLFTNSILKKVIDNKIDSYAFCNWLKNQNSQIAKYLEDLFRLGDIKNLNQIIQLNISITPNNKEDIKKLLYYSEKLPLTYSYPLLMNKCNIEKIQDFYSIKEICDISFDSMKITQIINLNMNLKNVSSIMKKINFSLDQILQINNNNLEILAMIVNNPTVNLENLKKVNDWKFLQYVNQSNLLSVVGFINTNLSSNEILNKIIK